MKNIVTIWGWTWTFNLVSALKQIDNVFIHAVVTMSDDGWSTGFLRDEYGILPPGDLRRALVALADKDKKDFLRKIFSYRFENWFLKWQNLWNLIMFAAEKIEKDYTKAINQLEELFEIKNWKVYPATTEKTKLLAKLENNDYIIWETNIDIPKHNWNLKIVDFYVIKEEYAQILKLAQQLNQQEIFNYTLNSALSSKVNWNLKLKEIFENADFIIIWPGDLYTSILPNLLVWDNINYLKKSKAKKIYISNLFTKFWETNWFKLSDFLSVFEKYLGDDIFDYILIQDFDKINLSNELLEKYKKEWKELVVNDLNDCDKILKFDLVSVGKYLRHDIEKLSNALKVII